MAWYRNHYTCSRCRKDWTQEWSTKAPDDCPRCGAPHVAPWQSPEISAPLHETPQEAPLGLLAGLMEFAKPVIRLIRAGWPAIAHMAFGAALGPE
jgi:hypothetical protein